MPRSPRSPTATSLARLIDAYAGTWDAVAAAVGVADDKKSDTPEQQLRITHDQLIKAAEVAALQRVAQKLSAIRQGGLNAHYSLR